MVYVPYYGTPGPGTGLEDGPGGHTPMTGAWGDNAEAGIVAAAAGLDEIAPGTPGSRIAMDRASATDRIYYVSTSAAASDTNSGLSPGRPKATIAGALTALGANPGVVRLLAGTFTLSNVLTCTTSGVTIEGTGAATIITFATNAPVPVLQFSSVANLVLRNLTIDFGSQTYATASVQVDGASSDITIENVRFLHGKNAIVLAPGNTDVVRRVRIEHCYFDSATTLGAVTAANIVGAVLDDVLVSNCHVVAVGGGAGNHAFHFVGSKIKIVNNVVEDAADGGCMITGCTDVTIAGNTLSSQHVTIFAGDGSHRVRITNNDITSVLDQGVALYDAATYGPSTEFTVTGNTIHDCALMGINVSDVYYVTVAGNTIRRCGQNTAGATAQRTGITVQINAGGANRGCNHVAITGNAIFDDAGTPKMQSGIYIVSPITGLVVAGNDVSGATTTQSLVITPATNLTAPYYAETDAGLYRSNVTTQTLAAPTATYGAGAGTAPPALTIAGKDSSGIVIFGTGTTPTAASIIFSVVFARAFASAPRVIGVGNNPAANPLGLYVDAGTVTTTGFNVYSTNAVAASHAATYEFGWIAVA